jgi:Protein of unknown function (DUF2842)
MKNPRKPIGSLVLLIWMGLWVWGVATLAPAAGAWPGLAEMVFYLAAGTLWVLPLRPVFRWMNAGDPPEDD